MTRLFIGTFVSEEDQQKIAQLPGQNADLEQAWKRTVRWVKPEKLHMTWVFLGSVTNELVQPITDMLSNLVSNELGKYGDKAPMKITFDKAEIWPEPRKPRQVVLRPNVVDERILQLGKVLRTGLLEFYFESSQKEEVRMFRPHITLLRLDRRQETTRIARPSSGARTKLSDLHGLETALPVVLTLDKIALIESQLGKNSAYQILHEVPMASKR